MKIVLLNKFLYLKGGAEKVFFEEMALLRSHGHHAIPFSRNSPKNIYSEAQHYFPPELQTNQDFSLRLLKSAIEVIYSRDVKRRFGKYVDAETPDIAHAHNIYGLLTTSVIDELYSRSIPIVLSLHDYKIICPNYQFLKGTDICEDCKTHRYFKAVQNKCVQGSPTYSLVYAVESYFNFITKKYLNKVSKYIAVSKFIKNKFIEYGFPEKEIVVIPNFINTGKYTPSYVDRKYFLFFGRLSKEKGVQTLITAFDNMKNKGYRLVIAGEGPLLSDLKKQVVDAGSDRIEFAGFLTGEPLAEAIRGCTAVIVPSEWYENCPMSVLESFAYGKPVIGAKIGGIPELIEDGTDGMIFESGNAADLATKMDNIVGLSEQELMGLGHNGRTKIEDRYNQEQHYDRLISLYESILHR